MAVLRTRIAASKPEAQDSTGLQTLQITTIVPCSYANSQKYSETIPARREKSETCGTQQAKESSMSPLETRQSLIVRLKSAQNELAWRDFVCTYERFLDQLARRKGVPERHIPDVTQQILLTIARSIDGWKDDGNVASFRRWLSTVSRNVVIRFMARERKQAGGIGGSELLAQLQNVEDKPDERYIQRYMSPEQARGDAVDTRSDMFSLGSVLYAMSTGRPPFRAESTYGILRRVTDDQPRPLRELNPEVPGWFEAVVMKLLSKTAEDRFDSVEQIAEILEQCLAHLQQPDVFPLPGIVRDLRPNTKSSRFRNGLLPTAAIVLGLLVVVYFVIIEQPAPTVVMPLNSAQETPEISPPAQLEPQHPWDDGVDRDLEQLNSEIETLLEETK